MSQQTQQLTELQKAREEQKKFKAAEAVYELFSKALQNSDSTALTRIVNTYKPQLRLLEEKAKNFSCVEQIALYTKFPELVTKLESDPDFNKLGDAFSAAYFGNRAFFEGYTGDINARNRPGGFTALHFACASNQVELVRYLTSSRDANVNAKATYDAPPLYFAVKKNHIEITKILREAKADFDAQFRIGTAWATALILAVAHSVVESDRAEMLDLLISYEPSLTKKLPDESTVAEIIRLMHTDKAPLPATLLQRITQPPQNSNAKEEKSFSSSTVSKPQNADAIETASQASRRKKKSKAKKKTSSAPEKLVSENSSSMQQTISTEITKRSDVEFQVRWLHEILTKASVSADPIKGTIDTLLAKEEKAGDSLARIVHIVDNAVSLRTLRLLDETMLPQLEKLPRLSSNVFQVVSTLQQRGLIERGSESKKFFDLALAAHQQSEDFLVEIHAVIDRLYPNPSDLKNRAESNPSLYSDAMQKFLQQEKSALIPRLFESLETCQGMYESLQALSESASINMDAFASISTKSKPTEQKSALKQALPLTFLPPPADTSMVPPADKPMAQKDNSFSPMPPYQQKSY